MFAIVSERSAPEWAAAIEVLAAAEPQHRFVFRTDAQLDALNDDEVAAAYAGADAVLLVHLFGAEADRMLGLLDRRPPRRARVVLGLNGDPRIGTRSRIGERALFAGADEATFEALSTAFGAQADVLAAARRLEARYPAQAEYVRAKTYWDARTDANTVALLRYLLQLAGARIDVPAPEPAPELLFAWNGGQSERPPRLERSRSAVVVLDYVGARRRADRPLHDALCAAIERRELACVRVLAKWGEASVRAVELLASHGVGAPLAAIVSLQDFVIGAGAGHDRVSRAFERLDVPVLKAVRLDDRDEATWRASEDGLPWDSVHYRIAMPEVQGLGQPAIVAVAGAVVDDATTGLRYRTLTPVQDEVDALAQRVHRWWRLQTLPNSEKRVAIVYYNHPPGRHNIGADNLDVPASLFEILRTLARDGYDVGELPESPEALLAMLQARGVNLPQDRAQLAAMAESVETLDIATYARWLDALP
ncbi:MAG: cobaltochelatase subunit CobN, partial [Polyangiaceae bacterium]|nr:cobaltochelatase subunit CobN [Polyangiaceae bacterium]